MIIVVSVVIGLLVLLTLVLFPVVGLALLPVVALAALALVAWLVVVLTRGPAALPEHPAPGEEGGVSARPGRGARRGTRADPSA